MGPMIQGQQRVVGYDPRQALASVSQPLPSSRSSSSNSGGSSTRLPTTVNGKIRNQLESAGNNVSYAEAQRVAQSLGVSIDRVFNQTGRTGQGVYLGRNAAAAGYDGSSLNRSSPIYHSDNYFRAVEAAGMAAGGDPAGAPTQPGMEFDWDAFNADMAARQQAVWASMDEMNAEFLRQNEELRNRQRNAGVNNISGLSSDGAQVRRRRRQRSRTNTVNQRTTSNPGVNTGGATGGANGLSIGGA